MKTKKIIWVPLIVIVCILLIGWIGLTHLRDNPGNPVSHALAEFSANQYIEKIPDFDYEITSVTYEEKDECYYIELALPESPDSHFQLGYNYIGQLTRNSYERQVIQKGNTAIRLSNEYSATVQKVLDSVPNSTAFSCSGMLRWQAADGPNDSSHYIISDELELDGVYDLAELGAKAGDIWMRVDVSSAEQVTVTKLAEMLLYVRQMLDKADLQCYTINCLLTYPNGTSSKTIYLYDFLYEDVFNEGLEARLAEALNL